MKKFLMLFMIVFLVVGASSQVDASEAGDFSLKWSQMPDWELGYDILSNYNDGYGGDIVADDFLCRDGKPITDIYWWGSYSGDTDPLQNRPSPATNFWVGFWSDVPVGSPENEFGYSYPDKFIRGYDFNGLIGEYDGYQEWAGHNGYEYYADISSDPFLQAIDNVYWISILAIDANPNDCGDPEEIWGWKTSIDHYNDDAVLAALDPEISGSPVSGTTWLSLVGAGGMQELIYPSDHLYAGRSVDMSFELVTPEPISMVLFLVGGVPIAARLYRKKRRKALKA